jgi:DNA-binding phage protein
MTEDEVKDEIIKRLRGQLLKARVENSMTQLAKDIGVDYRTLYKLQEGLTKL